MKKLLFPLSAVIALAGAESAFAAGLAIPGGPTVLDGSTSIADTSNDPAVAEALFRVFLEPNRSYACTVIGQSNFGIGVSDLDFVSMTDPSANSVFSNVSLVGDVTPVVSGDSADIADNRLSFTPSGTGTQTAGEYTIGVANQTGSSTNARFDCEETTLYGGFNTNVNDFNFLELINITNKTVSGTITATDRDGAVVINKQAFSVLPNRRADVDIHTPAGALKYGAIQVTHNGPYGALQGTVSQYDGTISNFVLTATLALHPRDK